ncbi:MAG: hypothetical protein PHU43_09915, partial [Candidatus Bipolaricaulis sp.]|nr:hypothetical protein [Candidatus Bipolaricaulis sp.]
MVCVLVPVLQAVVIRVVVIDVWTTIGDFEVVPQPIAIGVLNQRVSLISDVGRRRRQAGEQLTSAPLHAITHSVAVGVRNAEISVGQVSLIAIRELVVVTVRVFGVRAPRTTVVPTSFIDLVE